MDAHIELTAAYDLVGDCELFSPKQLDAMATADGRDPEGYCEFATRDALANATPEVKVSSKATYDGATYQKVVDEADTASFDLTSKDGSFTESVVVEKVDGRWYVRSIFSDEHDHSEGDGHDH